MRTRLRPALSAEALREHCGETYQHTQWPDHIERVAATVSFVLAAMTELGLSPGSIGDLSTGDAAIPRGIAVGMVARGGPEPALILGDYTPGLPITGMIERTVHEIPDVDLFVLSETAEHLDDPESVLAAIRARALLLSTPIGETMATPNDQHYWGWDIPGITELLVATGWTPRRHTVCLPGSRYYDFQIHLASREVAS